MLFNTQTQKFCSHDHLAAWLSVVKIQKNLFQCQKFQKSLPLANSCFISDPQAKFSCPEGLCVFSRCHSFISFPQKATFQQSFSEHCRIFQPEN